MEEDATLLLHRQAQVVGLLDEGVVDDEAGTLVKPEDRQLRGAAAGAAGADREVYFKAASRQEGRQTAGGWAGG